MECGALIRGLNLTDTEVHPIASRLSIRAVDREEQTVEVIKAFTDINRMLTKAYKSKEIKEEEDVNTVEEVNGLLYLCSESEEHTIRSPLAGNACFARGERGATFLTQATNGNVNATQLCNKNWMDGEAEYDSYITSCLSLCEYDRYVTATNNETDRKGRERVDQFTYENRRQAGMMKAQAIEKNPVQSKTLVQAVERPCLLYLNKKKDNSTVHTMFKDMGEQVLELKKTCEPEMKTCPKKAKKYKYIKEPKKIYELEMKTKKYSYIKDYKEQPRKICDQGEKKSLQALCNTQERLASTYEPKKIHELEIKNHTKKTKEYNGIKDCKGQPREIRDKDDIQVRHSGEDGPHLRDQQLYLPR